MPLTINELQKKRVQYIQQANPQVIQDSINQYLTLERNSKADVAAYGISRAYNVIASWTPLQNAVDAIPGYPVFLGMIPSLATFEQYKNQIHAVFSFNEWFELIETVTFHQYQQQKIKNHFMRMTDFQANGSIMAAVDTVFQFSIALLEAEANGKNIYFHCKAGRARSAMMLAVCIWHHEKYVKGNVNADYNKIVASLKMTRSQVDIGEEKHALAREIMRGIDEFYTAYPAIPDEQPEILQDVTNPKYVFSTVLQLPVLKAAVKAGQWIKNTSPSELDQGSLEKFINCIKDCKHDWLSVLANNVRPEGMDEQIFEDIQFFKRCYPDVACSMVFDLIKKEEVDIAPAFDYKGFYEQLQTAIEHYKGDKILRWFPGTVGGSRASTEVFLAEFVEAESNSYFMKKLESRNKAQQVFMGILIYRMESLQDLDAYKNLYNGSENYPNDKENHQRLVDVIEKFKPRQGENPPFANMGPLFQLFFERLMIGLDPRTGETISTGIRFNSPATDDEKDLKRIHYLFMNVSDLADYCFKSDQPIFPFAKPDIVKPLSKNLFAFFGVNSQEAIRLIDSRLVL